MKNIKVKVQLDEGAAMPTRAHDTDVGYDVKALTVTVIDNVGVNYDLDDIDALECFCEKNITPVKVKIDTGVHIHPEPGYWVELVPNSRLAKSCFMYANSMGIIDPSYTGSMRVILNVVDVEQFYPSMYNLLRSGTVGQLIIREQISADFQQVDKLDDTDRGDGGFGSTEKKESPCESCKHADMCAIDDAWSHAGHSCKNYNEYEPKK